MAGNKEVNSDLQIKGKINLKDVPNNTPTGFLVWNSGIKDIAQRTPAQIISDLGLITATNIAASYYTKTQLQTSGQSQVHWGNLTNIPTSFPATAHNHDDRYYTETEVDTNIKTAVDNIQIGGRNLILNSNKPSKFINKGSLPEIQFINTDGDNNPTPNNSEGVYISGGAIGDKYTDPTPQIKLKPNTDYIFSFDINWAGQVSSSSYYFITKKSGGYDSINIIPLDTPNNTWTRKVIKFRTTSESDSFNFRLGKIYSGGAYWIIYANFKLEEGNIPTDGTPAPEDQVSDWNTIDVNDFSFIKNKPTKLSQFTNDSGYLTPSALSPYAQTSWVNANFDKYTAWNLQTNNVQRTSMPSGSNLNLVAGANVSINYSAGGTVTINATNTDTNTTYVAGDGISITGANNVITNTKPNIVQTLSGSGNTVNLSNGGSYTIPAQSWGSITGKPEFNFLPSNPQLTYGASGLNYFNIANVAGNDPKLNQTPTNAWHHIIRMNHANAGGYYADLAISMTDNSGISRRVISNGAALSDWVKLWDSSNFNPDGKANAHENATGIGLASGQNPNATNSAFPYFYSTYGVISIATRKWVADDYIPKSHPVYNITQANIDSWNESFKRRTSFVSNIDANDKSFLSGYYSIETANGTGNTNFPSNSAYGVFSRMSANFFTTDVFYYNDGDMVFRTFHNPNTPSNWRTVWDNVNLTKISQLSNDAGYLTSLPTHSHSEYVTLDTAQTISGVKTFSNSVTAPAFYESSLRSLKTNIQPFEKSGLDLIKELDIVTFDRKDETAKNKIGIIADDTPKEFLSEELDAVDLYKTVFIQAKAIQELTEEVNNLRELLITKLNQL